MSRNNVSLSFVVSLSLAGLVGACGPNGQQQPPTTPERTGPMPPPVEREQYPEMPPTEEPTQPGAEAEDAQAAAMNAEVLGQIQQNNMMEIRMAELAQDKSQNDQVKMIATRVLEDHRRAEERVSMLSQELGVQVEPPPSDPMMAETMDRLQQAEGAEFDREYLRAMADINQQAVDRLQQAQGMVDERVGDLVDQHVSMLTEHREEAESLLRAAPSARAKGRGRT